MGSLPIGISKDDDLLAIHDIHALGGLEDAAALEIIIVDGGWLMVDGGNANGDIADLCGSLDGADLVGAVEDDSYAEDVVGAFSNLVIELEVVVNLYIADIELASLLSDLSLLHLHDTAEVGSHIVGSSVDDDGHNILLVGGDDIAQVDIGDLRQVLVG